LTIDKKVDAVLQSRNQGPPTLTSPSEGDVLAAQARTISPAAAAAPVSTRQAVTIGTPFPLGGLNSSTSADANIISARSAQRERDPKNLRVLNLPSGPYEYDVTDLIVPPPTLTQFAKNISTLAAEWECSKYPVLRNQSVKLGLKHWKELYHGAVWNDEKSQWNDWKVRLYQTLTLPITD
jgi:hypothetical protein